MLVYVASKNQNPRKGIEMDIHVTVSRILDIGLQKTKIPARGLKSALECRIGQAESNAFKKPKSPQGD